MIIYEPTVEDREIFASLKVNPSSLKDDGKKYDDVAKPWGREREISLTQDHSIWRLYIEGEQETSLHCHPHKNTLMIVESGLIRLETLGGETRYETGACILIEKGVFHRTKAEKGGAIVAELEWPPNRSDIVRLNDKYGRGKTGYL